MCKCKKTSRLTEPQSAYIHFPFCKSKCNYCDFNSFSGMEELFPHYINALLNEIDSQKIYNLKPLKSVYFGGGTPTIINSDDLLMILKILEKKFGFSENCEITIEANPNTINFQSLSMLSKKFNRISIGVQSFNDDILKFLGRQHTSKTAKNAIKQAKQAGFSNISIDIIYAVPSQSFEILESDLKAAVDYNPDHISFYELSIEKNTPIYNMLKKNRTKTVDEDTQIRMYKRVINCLDESGYVHYEVSNFSKINKKSVHNQTYWKNMSYYGFGAGAVSYIECKREKRETNPEVYISKVLSNYSPIVESEIPTKSQRIFESIMLGLRMRDGIDLYELNSNLGIDLLSDYEEIISNLIEKKLLEVSEGRIKTTFRGLLLLNDIASAFIIN